MLTVKISYTVELSPSDFRLISTALRGRLKPEWEADARLLQDRLFRERNAQVSQALNNINKMDNE